MTVQYPKGFQPRQAKAIVQAKQKTDIKSFSKRGIGLEDEINEANAYYLANNLAVIHKKPTPITIVKVDYPNRAMAKITEAYFNKASTTDYNGLYQGKYIDFDAKETRNKTNFPLKNFHEHQMLHLKRILIQGGVGFVIIRFTSLDESYVYPAEALIAHYEAKDGKKSIPYADIARDGFLIEKQLQPALDYLRAVDVWLENLDNKE
ncbi:MAG TPA: Holliday junction resolvase RecU [Lactobacillaceae bacterium]|jgi:recombination protein U